MVLEEEEVANQAEETDQDPQGPVVKCVARLVTLL